MFDIAGKVLPEIGWPPRLHSAIATLTKPAMPFGAKQAIAVGDTNEI
jgi:hypothetical protein